MIDAATRVLILGSFPGEASLAAGQYYAHPRNHFWPLLAALLGLPLVELSYRRRLLELKRRRIGLWDIIVRCSRAGSLDSAIRLPQHADLRIAQRRTAALELICFNGKTAARAESEWRAAGYVTRVLPSSSPAYTLPLAEKLDAWRAALGDVVQP